MVSQELLRHCAFWDKVVCLECGFAEDAEALEDPEDVKGEICPRCSRPSVWSPHIALQLVGLVGPEED